MSTPASTATIGRLGEDLAARHLERAGWHLLHRNYRVARGELDIVALDGQTLVFVEVKTRRTLATGAPQESVTAQKLRRLRHLAGYYLMEQSPPHRDLRIDVIAIHLPHGDVENARLQHLTGVGQ